MACKCLISLSYFYMTNHFLKVFWSNWQETGARYKTVIISTGYAWHQKIGVEKKTMRCRLLLHLLVVGERSGKSLNLPGGTVKLLLVSGFVSKKMSLGEDEALVTQSSFSRKC